jgi:hypothetical protein
LQHLGGGEAHPVDESAVGAAQILDDELSAIPGQAGVATGDLGVVDYNFVARFTTDDDSWPG